MSAQAIQEDDYHAHSEGDQTRQCFGSLQSSSNHLDWTMHTQFLGSGIHLRCPPPSPFPGNESDDEHAHEFEPFDIYAKCAADTDILSERWDVSKDTAEFLAHNVLLFAKTCGEEDTSSPISYLRSMKIQEPVLRTDHELEMLDVKRRNITKPNDIGDTSFGLEIEEGESLSWPSRIYALAASAITIVRTEKLGIDKHTVLLLQDVVSEGNVKAGDEVSRASIKLSNARQQMSPPILPLSPLSTSAFVPDANLDFTSTPEDPDTAQLANLEYDLMQEHLRPCDSIVQRPNDGLCKIPEILSSNSSPVTMHRKRVRDFMIDTPPLPISSDTPTEKRAKRQVFGLGTDFSLLHAASDLSLTGTRKADSEVDQLLEDVVVPGALAAAEQLENEQLSRIDTLMRVEVPEVENISPVPPWEVFLLDSTDETDLVAQRTWLKYVKHELLQSEQKWRGASRLERSLPWSPFPSRLAIVDLHEMLHEVPLSDYLDSSLPEIERMDDNTTQLASTFQRILREWGNSVKGSEYLDRITAVSGEDVDYRNQNSHNINNDMVPVDTKSAIAPAKPTSDRHQSPTCQTNALETLLQLRRAQINRSTHGRASALLPCTNPLDSNAQVSANTADLSGFMHRLGNQMHTPATGTQQLPIFVHDVDAFYVDSSQHLDESKANEQQQMSLKQLTPKLDSHFTKAFSVIMSPSMLADRAFAKALQHLLPNTLFIERECPIPIPESGRGNDAGRNVTRSAVDMIIAPTTGIIVTSSQQLRQKALPGRAPTFGVRERVAAALQSVQRLLIMIRDTSQSLDDGTSTTTLDQRDCDALTDLTGTTANFDVDVHVLIISGGVDVLARWTASAIVRYSGESDGGLLPEETTWERLLCAAGIDAFAAQVILKSLKRPRSMPSGSDVSEESTQGATTGGLPTLVKMAAKQRMKRFSPLLGGAAVISRFNDVMDMLWTSRSDALKT